jgi:phage gp46-like protein
MTPFPPCADQNLGRRRIFWTTRPAVCGDYIVCGATCAIPGLEYEDHGEERTIKTDDWLHGLILNILNTRARTDAKCPSPMAVYGHWSESYRGDSMYIGSTLWNAADKSYVRVADSVQAIATAIRADMSKLIALDVAQSVEVEAVYRGQGRVDVTIIVKSTTKSSQIDLSGKFVSDTWVWQ